MWILMTPRRLYLFLLVTMTVPAGACADWSPTVPNANQKLSPSGGSPASSTPAPSPIREPSPGRTASPSPVIGSSSPVERGAAFRPGGLGATVEQWEELYGPPTRGESGESRYAGGRFVALEVSNGRVQHVQVVYGDDDAISHPDAQSVARVLLPADAVLKSTLETPSATPGELYHSPALAGALDPEAFGGSTPGEITVLYRPAAELGKVETVVVMTGRPSSSG